jgi:hypothetical protein
VTAYENPAQMFDLYTLAGDRLTYQNPAMKPVFENIPDREAVRPDAGTLARHAQTLAASKLAPDEKRKALGALCESAGVDYPVSRWGFGPEVKRLCDSHWWTRKIYTRERRAWEALQIAQKKVNKGKQLYCSDQAVYQWRAMRARNREFLQGMFVFNDDAFMASLAEVAAKSVSNPEIRRAEMMARLRGMEEYAQGFEGEGLEHGATFLTITCPSRYHANSATYSGATPKQAQAYLCAVWARVRAELARQEITMYGFRVAEPHNDGCPHWHLIIFARKFNLWRVEKIARAYARAEDKHELKSRGASRARFHAERIKLARSESGYKGGAVAYIAKYISKNIDGKRSDGTSMGPTIDRDGNQVSGDAIVTAERVLAWSSMWGIRQFQQFGGERVGPYRELRRVHSIIAGSAALEVARKAADLGEFSQYMKHASQVQGLATVKRSDAVEAVKRGDDKAAMAALNKYCEPVFRVVGLEGDGLEIITRRDDWRVLPAAAAEAAIHLAYDAADSDELVEAWGELVEWFNLRRLDVFRGSGLRPAQPVALDLCQ